MAEERWTQLAVKLAERNMDMKQLSELTGMHVKSIYRAMKKGPGSMRVQSIGKIAEALGVEVKELL